MIGTAGFIGERLREALEARGMTAVALADVLGVSPMAISQYENNKHSPRPESMRAIAEKLNLPESFFKQPILPMERRPRNIFWRSFSSATKTARERCGRRLHWLEQIVHYLREFLDLPQASLPQFALPENLYDLTDGQIEELASECRQFWGLKDGPLPEMLLLLENNGVIISHTMLDSERLDAFSQWRDRETDFPYIVLGAEKASAVRSRYNAAHELAHLVLHAHLKMPGSTDKLPQIEHQAFRFASAFLLPAQSFLSELWAPTLEAFRSLKERWKVAIGVMIKRCEELGIINEAQTQRLWINYSRRGWRKHEPLDDLLPIEKPRLLKRSFELLIGERIRTKNEILSDLPYAASDIEELAGLSLGYFSTEFPAEVTVLPKPKYREGNPQTGPAKVIDFSRFLKN